MFEELKYFVVSLPVPEIHNSNADTYMELHTDNNAKVLYFSRNVQLPNTLTP